MINDRNIKDISIAQKRMLDILEDTCEFYKADPIGRRAFVRLTCYYFHKDTSTGEIRKCAIGRLMSDETLQELVDHNLMSDPIADIWHEISAPELKTLSLEYLYDLQRLHDTNIYWDMTLNKITTCGLSHYEKMKKRIINNEYRNE